MNGPLKFWSLVSAAILALFAVLLYTRPTQEPAVAPSSEVPAVSPASPHGQEVSRPPSDSNEETASTSRFLPDQAPISHNPIQLEMNAWAGNYRTQMARLLPPLNALEASSTVDRSVCNDLLTATYNAQNLLEGSPDPDIEESLERALETFAEAGRLCLQRKAGFRDTYLLLARSGVTLVEGLLEERYSESGVPGLAEPMEGGSEVGRRAVEFTESLKEEH